MRLCKTCQYVKTQAEPGDMPGDGGLSFWCSNEACDVKWRSPVDGGIDRPDWSYHSSHFWPACEIVRGKGKPCAGGVLWEHSCKNCKHMVPRTLKWWHITKRQTCEHPDVVYFHRSIETNEARRNDGPCAKGTKFEPRGLA